MKNLAFFGCLLAASAFAEPAITDNVTFEQTNQLVKIAYTLENEPAVVTVDILSNGVTVPGQAFSNPDMVYGPWNRKLDPGDYEVVWRPDATWANTYLKNGTVSVRVQAWATNTPPDYMVVDLTSATNIMFATSTNALPGGIDSDLYRTSHLVMRRCPAKDVVWYMGSGTSKGVNPKHKVKFTEDYYFAVFPTTQMQYKNLNGNTAHDCYFTNRWECRAVDSLGLVNMRGKVCATNWPHNTPLHKVDAGTPLDRLRQKTGLEFDLPTSAQWEFACRAGVAGTLNSGADQTQAEVERLGRVKTNGGWAPEAAEWPEVTSGSVKRWRDDSPRTKEPYCHARAWSTEYGTPRVGSYAPNDWGIYDLYGNLWEITTDHTPTYDYDGEYKTTYVDPVGEENRELWGGTAQTYSMRDGSNWFTTWTSANSASVTTSSSGGDLVRSACRLACPAVIPADVK